MKEVNMHHLENHHLLDLGAAAHQGEEVVITRDGQPWLRLTPCPDYTPPPMPKSREEIWAKAWEKMSPEAKAFWSDPEVQEALTEAVMEPWAYLPERELCAECRTKYRADCEAQYQKALARKAKGGV